MESKIKNGNLVIALPLEDPRPSATGKTLLIASTRGVKRSDARYKGKTVSIVANAFIFPDIPASKSNDREDDDDE